jgi:hypothetical protein
MSASAAVVPASRDESAAIHAHHIHSPLTPQLSPQSRGRVLAPPRCRSSARSHVRRLLPVPFALRPSSLLALPPWWSLVPPVRGSSSHSGAAEQQQQQVGSREERRGERAGQQQQGRRPTKKRAGGTRTKCSCLASTAQLDRLTRCHSPTLSAVPLIRSGGPIRRSLWTTSTSAASECSGAVSVCASLCTVRRDVASPRSRHRSRGRSSRTSTRAAAHLLQRRRWGEEGPR